MRVADSLALQGREVRTMQATDEQKLYSPAEIQRNQHN